MDMTGFPLAAFVVIALILTGCQAPVLQPEFGAPYEIIINESGGSPDAPPRITGDWLLLTVSYTGGCTDHEFILESESRRDTAYVWLNHIDHNDACASQIIDDLSIELPTGILATRIISMFDPSGEIPHYLKW